MHDAPAIFELSHTGRDSLARNASVSRWPTAFATRSLDQNFSRGHCTVDGWQTASRATAPRPISKSTPRRSLARRVTGSVHLERRARRLRATMQ
jgi:hypothetical protein